MNWDIDRKALCYIIRNGLCETLSEILWMTSLIVKQKQARISLVEFEDGGGDARVEIELHCGLRGKEAVCQERIIGDAMFDRFAAQQSNQFVITVT